MTKAKRKVSALIALAFLVATILLILYAPPEYHFYRYVTLVIAASFLTYALK
jgi:hypothetical protein